MNELIASTFGPTGDKKTVPDERDRSVEDLETNDHEPIRPIRSLRNADRFGELRAGPEGDT